MIYSKKINFTFECQSCINQEIEGLVYCTGCVNMSRDSTLPNLIKLNSFDRQMNKLLSLKHRIECMLDTNTIDKESGKDVLNKLDLEIKALESS